MRIIGSIFFWFHCVAIFVANLPESFRPKPTLHSYVSSYLEVFGLWQDWRMFSGIPDLRTYDLTLETSNGRSTTMESLPVLASEYTFSEARSYSRIYTLFSKLDKIQFNEGWRSYLDRMCRHRRLAAGVSISISDLPVYLDEVPGGAQLSGQARLKGRQVCQN